METTLARIHSLDLWKSKIDIEPISGGITNQNFIVRDSAQAYFVRIGEDIPEHNISRQQEHATSRAAYEAGISPAVLHTGPGIMVLQYIEGKTLTATDIQQVDMLPQAMDLIQRCHLDIPACLSQPGLSFRLFQVLQDYSHTLNRVHSAHRHQLPGLMSIATRLQKDIGETPQVFAHNDLLPANFIHDGHRLWLIDWDYAGYNSALFDLGGLAGNCDLPVDLEQWMLTEYYGHAADAGLMRQYSAMKCVSLLRESLWSMVSEAHPRIEFDYAGYTRQNLTLFQQAWENHQLSHKPIL